MVKKIAAIAGGVLIGLVIAFARVGAFPFWGSDSDASKAPHPYSAGASKSRRAVARAAGAWGACRPPAPAEPNTPEPGEKVGVITSFAPLVKKMIPAVVSVNVVQDVKVSGMPFGPQAGTWRRRQRRRRRRRRQGGGGDQGARPPAGGGAIRSISCAATSDKAVSANTSSTGWARA